MSAVPLATRSGSESPLWLVTTTMATPSVTMNRITSIHAASFRLSTRSVMTPAGNEKRSQGNRVTTATAPMCNGLRVTAEASQG